MWGFFGVINNLETHLSFWSSSSNQPASWLINTNLSIIDNAQVPSFQTGEENKFMAAQLTTAANCSSHIIKWGRNPTSEIRCTIKAYTKLLIIFVYTSMETVDIIGKMHEDWDQQCTRLEDSKIYGHRFCQWNSGYVHINNMRKRQMLSYPVVLGEYW